MNAPGLSSIIALNRSVRLLCNPRISIPRTMLPIAVISFAYDPEFGRCDPLEASIVLIHVAAISYESVHLDKNS